MGWGSGVAVSRGVGRRHSSDPALLWLWCRLAATVPIRPLAWEPPYAADAAIKRQTNKKPVFLGVDVFAPKQRETTKPGTYILLCGRECQMQICPLLGRIYCHTSDQRLHWSGKSAKLLAFFYSLEHRSYQCLQHTSHLLLLLSDHYNNIYVTGQCNILWDVQEVQISLDYMMTKSRVNLSLQQNCKWILLSVSHIHKPFLMLFSNQNGK